MPADAPQPPPSTTHTSPQPDPTPPDEEQARSSQQKLQQQQQVLEQQACMPNTNVDNTHQTQAPASLTHTKYELKQEELPNDGVPEPDSDFWDAEEPPQEFAYVDLLALRREVQCPICLGIIKKTRTVMECLHRFCRECIDKSMRMGNNECPGCRTHCASRRSLRDDPRYDELIAALYPDIKKFEEEELAFYEEDETRNKQIQETITQVVMKQTEALGKKRPGNKDIAESSVARSQRNNSSTPSRRKRRSRNGSTVYQDSEDNKDVNDSNKHHSTYDQYQETYQRKRKSRASIASSQSPSTTNFSGESPEDNVGQKKEERGSSPGLTEILVWGRGGVRNIRHGKVSDMNRSAHLAKLVEFLRYLENDEEYMALQVPLRDKFGQVLAMQEPNGSCDDQSTLSPSSCSNDKPSQVAGLLHIIDRDEKLSGVATSGVTNGEQLILSYQRKETMQAN